MGVTAVCLRTPGNVVVAKVLIGYAIADIYIHSFGELLSKWLGRSWSKGTTIPPRTIVTVAQFSLDLFISVHLS